MNGELYNCHDSIFIERKARAAAWCERYNDLHYSRRNERRRMLGELLGSVGSNVSIGTDFICDFGDNIHIGNNVSINHRYLFVDSNSITIGNNVLIAPGVQINTSTHPVALEERLTKDWMPESGEYFCRTRALSREDLETGIIVPVHEGDEQEPGDSLRPGYMVLLCSPEFGGRYKYQSPVFQPGGEYSGKVVARLGGVQDPLAEAERLAGTLVRHADGAHNPLNQEPMGDLGKALAQFRAALQDAGDDAEAKAAAIRAFADVFADAERGVLQNIGNSFQANPPPVDPPNAFASAITDILFNNFAALKDALGYLDGLAMYSDAKNVVANELHKPAGSPNRIIAAIKEDAQQAGGDKDYTIDIGV